MARSINIFEIKKQLKSTERRLPSRMRRLCDYTAKRNASVDRAWANRLLEILVPNHVILWFSAGSFLARAALSSTGSLRGILR